MIDGSINGAISKLPHSLAMTVNVPKLGVSHLADFVNWSS